MIFRRIFGPVIGNGVWRIHTNQELMNLYREPDIISEIKIKILGYGERMSEERILQRVFKSIPERKKSVGKPRNICSDDVEIDLKKKGVRGWS
jgi:hypothetical protein